MFAARIVAASAVVAAVALFAPLQPALAMNAGMVVPSDPSAASLVATEQSLLDLTNTDRVTAGDTPVQFDAELLPIARARAEEQLGTPSLSHYDPNGQLIFARLLNDSNLSFNLAGENLARASEMDKDLTQRIEQALMQSPMHRKNILEPTFARAAIGAATDPTTGQVAFAEIYRN